MRVLFVNSCPRGKDSRTLKLAVSFLHALKGAEMIEHDLNTMGLESLNAASLARREAICNVCDWEQEMVLPAREFCQADLVVISADGLKGMGGEAGLWKLPGLAQTPAGRHKQLLTIDDMALLGFGPRTPQAIIALRNKAEQLP